LSMFGMYVHPDGYFLSFPRRSSILLDVTALVFSIPPLSRKNCMSPSAFSVSVFEAADCAPHLSISGSSALAAFAMRRGKDLEG